MQGRLFPSFGVGQGRARRGLGDFQVKNVMDAPTPLFDTPLFPWYTQLEAPVMILGRSFTYLELAAAIGLGVVALSLLDVGRGARRYVRRKSGERKARKRAELQRQIAEL